MISALKWTVITLGSLVLFFLFGSGSDPIAYAWKMSPGTAYFTEPDAAQLGILKPQTLPMFGVLAGPVGEASATSSIRSVRIPIMVYHSVRPYIPDESAYQDAYDVTPELLEEELQYLHKQGYHTVTFAAVSEYFERGTPLPEKPVILSFDDGWRNQFVYAFPLLQKYGAKGTFFIFTNPIEYEKDHWMSWDEVRTLDRAGMEIGGHTKTHPILRDIMSDAALDIEIGGGKKLIEERIGHPITAFAYPFGLFNSETNAAVLRAGYHMARTVYKGVWNDPEHRLVVHGTLSSDQLKDFEKLLETE